MNAATPHCRQWFSSTGEADLPVTHGDHRRDRSAAHEHTDAIRGLYGIPRLMRYRWELFDTDDDDTTATEIGLIASEMHQMIVAVIAGSSGSNITRRRSTPWRS